jgi:hypothetical protein
METTTTTPEKEPPFIRACRLIVKECNAMHLDNMTGRIIHSKKVERALERMGLSPDGPDEWDDVCGRDVPIVIKRSHGGPKLNPVLVDMTTANMVVSIYEALSPANRARFPELIQRTTVISLVLKLWKLTR